MPKEPRAARAALHYWEEPCISGTEGSGAVFFSGCTLRCVFCQNYEIAAGTAGKPVTLEQLSEVFLKLQSQGANNINLVTAGHFLDTVIPALEKAKDEGLRIPIVYNTGGYEKTTILKRLDGLVDIYLPDYKYRSPKLSARYSHAADYPERAAEALEEMVRQAGKPVFDKRGMMKRGVIVRHLVLPGCVSDSKDVLEYLWDHYGNRIYVSIMSQYTPLPHVAAYPELNRKVTAAEYEEVTDYALFLGMEQVYIQEGESASESFIPPFDYGGLL
jgi:putative pyruvate formate lyase activating enzyme